MKILLSLGLLTFSLSIAAQQPNWASLLDTIEAAFSEDNPEVSKQIYLYQRCSAQQLAMAWVLQEADENLAATFDQTASTLAQAAAITRVALATERTGSPQDVAEISNSVLQTVTALLEQYQSWLNNNYLLNGSYLENDADLQLELEICTRAAQLAATLMDEQ